MMYLNEDYRFDSYHKIAHCRRMLQRRGLDMELLTGRLRWLREKLDAVETSMIGVSLPIVALTSAQPTR